MAGLRDQLLKTGLVDSRQVRKVEREKVKAKKSGLPDPLLEQDHAQQHKDKAARDRQLNHQRQQQLAQRELEAQARQMIEARQIPEAVGEVPFHFAHGGKIKRRLLSEAFRQQLVDGQIGICSLNGGYAYVPRETLIKIRERHADAVLLLNEPRTGLQDDPELQHPVPDDLVW